MKCGEIFDLLLRIDSGDAEVPDRAVDELIGLGLLAEMKAVSGEDAAVKAMKDELAEAIAERKKLAGAMTDFIRSHAHPAERTEYQTMVTRMDYLASKSAELRTRILQASAKPTAADCLRTRAGRYIQMTYLGREVFQNIGSRQTRVSGLEYSRFREQMASVSASFRLRAGRAKAILKVLSPKLKSVDEIHLRTAAIGLSCIDAPPGKVAETFIRYYQSLNSIFHKDNKVLATEAFTIMEYNAGHPVDIAAVKALVGNLYDSKYGRFDEDYTVERTATLLHACPGVDIPKTLHQMDQFRELGKGTPLTTRALLAMECLEGESEFEVTARFEEFLRLIDDIGKGQADFRDRQTAAALLTSSETDKEVLLKNYRIASNLMQDLFLTRLDTAAAMIAIMDQDVTETIDNIRLASGEIMRAKLSISGLENFSLGLKLVMHTGALLQPGPARANAIPKPEISTELIGMSVMLPLGAGIPFLVFHEESVHKRAVSDYRFHPVHSHYVYG